MLRSLALLPLLTACLGPARLTEQPADAGPEATSDAAEPATDAGESAPAELTVDPGPAPVNFGNCLVGTPFLPVTFTVTNTGGSDSGPIAIAADGNVGDFPINAGECDGRRLGAGETCTIEVGFKPTADASLAAAFTVSASPGGSRVLSVAGTGLAPGDLTVSPSTHDFGVRALGDVSGTLRFTVTNTGAAATGPLVLSLANDGAFAIAATTCSGPLAAGAECTIDVRHQPAAVGALSTSLTISADPGGNAVVNLAGTGSARVTVSRSGTGAGLITSVPLGIHCDGSAAQSCSADFTSAGVTLTAQGNPGDVLVGWWGDCAGTAATCAVSLTSARSAGARVEGPRSLQAAITGTGQISGTGLTCSAGTCTGSYAYGSSVTLTAQPAAGQFFAGWGGACSGAGQSATCMLA
ncbi:MAG TPA: choice-of-anchor D domain-containing protein, partial [Kofleriaceae bacterium]|nr:choice-of-anchor D domain-containing protein [Kofleriaceae bacterium]